MTESNQPADPANHAAHDPTWMAALATRNPDLSPSERTRAETALESCGACADLFADLVAVSAAIPSAAIPARPRDFTLTATDAARLQRRGFARLFKGIGSARDRVTFPLAMGLTTMGIAGLLLATIPSAFSAAGGATSLAPVGDAAQMPAAASAAPAASAAAPAPAPAAESTDIYGFSAAPTSETAGGGEVFSGDDGDAALEARLDAAATLQAIRDDATGRSALLVVAGTLLIVGLGLFLLRWSARRL
jgi:hypothetical protein